ncbi:hypothetical protein BTR23_14765 [Alkalihalophilus pseudofirmus]|nr:hypothetical protein BTR23_14765 [Alkalihalophilus pseudofirmus]
MRLRGLLMLENTIGKLFDKAITHFPERIAVKDNRRSISYANLGIEVNRLANAFIKLGIRHGDRIAIWMENCIEYVVTHFAIVKIGAVRVPLNTMLNEVEVAYRLDDAEVSLIICDEQKYQLMNGVLEKIQIQPSIISTSNHSELSYQKLIENTEDRLAELDVKPHDLAALMYTGGTTGRSKGVMHTHKTILSIEYSQILEYRMNLGEVFLHCTPLPHASGFLILSGLLRGGTHILHTGFNIEHLSETIEKEKVTFFLLVPTMIYKLLDSPRLEKYDFSSLNTLFYGAAPMSPDRIRQALDVWGPVLMQGYSQMEVANQTSILSKEDHIAGSLHDEKRLSSIGRSIIMSEVKIVDDNGKEVASGKVGELITRGPHMMKGYWKLEEETNKVIRDGWLYTGDMAYRDESDYLYLVDRKKDMVITGGFNVYTIIVEKVLLGHPHVKHAAVIGVPHKTWGEAIKAFVVTDDPNIDEKELFEFCKKRLSKYEVPKSITFVSTLPLTPYGKLDKKALREPFWGKSQRQVN